MRVVQPIGRRGLADEHVIGTDPPLRPELPGVWNRRLNAFTGRALSARALSAEQQARSGIQRLRGQGVTAGVVSGLDVMLEPGSAGAKPEAVVLQILPGFGLARSGEDVTVSTPRRIVLHDLPVHAPVHLLNAVASGAAAGGPEPDNPAEGEALRPPFPRRAGPRFKDILAAPAAADFPRVALLVAEPVTATIFGRPRDTCPPDPRDDPYDDLRLIDGVRLALYFWPAEMRSAGSLPDYALPGFGTDRRNRLAYTVFARERSMGPDDTHPWEELGAPLGVFAFNEDWTLDFLDRSAVARLGGQPKARTQLVDESGSPLLWHARVAQFAEHLAGLPDLTNATLISAFRQLPPVGFLPAGAIDIAARRQSLFPPGFSISMTPAPLEHIDLAVSEAASLIPIKLDVPDAIELLVPVPERVYEPGLLETATVDAAFAREMQRLIAERTDWLIRRELVRRRRGLLLDAASGLRQSTPASHLATDEALPYEETRGPVAVTRIRRVDVTAGGVQFHTMKGAKSTLSIAKGDRLFLWVRVASADALRGFSLRLTAKGGTALAFGRFWGSASNLPIGRGDAAIDQRSEKAGVPADQRWTRLELEAGARWDAAGADLIGEEIVDVEFAQAGGLIEWGPLGKIDGRGNETIFVGDDAPPGAVLTTGENTQGWPFVPTGLGAAPSELDFGTSEAAGVRTALAIDAFRARWPHKFLAVDFEDLEEGGIDGFTNAVEKRLKATNDVIDLGFVRARSDIYRVRQFMLGADAASRLVTSPALADIAVREEGARAKSADLSAFLKTAYKTDFERDPEAPLETKPVRTAPPVDTTPRVTDVAPSRTFLSGFAISRFSTLTSATARPAPIIARVAEPVAVTPTRSFISAASPAAAFQPITAFQPVATFQPAIIQPASQASTFSVAASTAALRFDRVFVGRDIQAQLALPGVVERTVSVAERLKPSPAVEAYNFAMAGKFEVINAIARLLAKEQRTDKRPRGIAVGDLPAPGFKRKDGAPAPAPEPEREIDTIGDVIADRDTRSTANREYIDLDERTDAAKNHEADYFTSAVGAIDNSVALMRLVEGRVDLYRKLLDDARDVRDELMEDVARADARLRTIAVEVEEARHDVNVARSLLAEETARVAALNAKRKAIIETHVTTVIFRRARRAQTARFVPVAPATGALAEGPVAVCLREHDSVPEELRDYAGLFRDAPVSWFPGIRSRLPLIDRLDAARAALIGVRLRAANPIGLIREFEAEPPRLLKAVHSAFRVQRAIVDERRTRALQVDFARSAVAELAQAHQLIGEHASLADIMAGEHSRPALSRTVASEIEGIGQVAGCLHASFGETPPLVRLRWAEELSAFDRPAPLQRLSGLEGWNALPLELRREQQSYVDWLFSRIDRGNDQAQSAINELIRICLLLAAHAPVERLIPARLVAPAPSRVGGRLDLSVNVKLARIGMTAVVRGADAKPIAHAVVEDLADGVARARIVKTFSAVSTISANFQVELSDRRLS